VLSLAPSSMWLEGSALFLDGLLKNKGGGGGGSRVMTLGGLFEGQGGWCT